MLDIDFHAATLPAKGALVLLVPEDGERPALYLQADEATQGAVSRGLEAAEFNFGKGKSCVLFGPGAGLSRIVVIGLGKRSELDVSAAEAAGSAAWNALKGSTVAALGLDGLAPELAAHAAFGAVLASYRFDLYRTKQKQEEKPRLAHLSVLASSLDSVQAAWPELAAIAHGVFITRDLVSEPANILTPSVFADRIATLSSLGLEIEIFDPEQMAELGFGALLGVAMGSDLPARMAVMRWNGAPENHEPPIAFVGKGVTFDSGGIS
ncbi:MAG: M17 family peptidase N-terminal domain-containing protein, partial [Janthinobacterium lividum]